VPVIFVADWHVGSWGSDHRLADDISDEIERLGLYVAILGDMVQMAVNSSQGLAALHDNAIDEAKQMRWLRAWVDRLRPLILWSVWDNHAVIRQEKALGYSEYAELFKEKVIYSSGIAHVDLSIGPTDDDYETYRIATSHRFSGSSDDNPCRGGQQYLMRKALDREIAVCGDSHRPGVLTYPHADQRRCSINVGSLQTDSSYSKRVASLYTHTDQPIVEFWPDEHAFHVYDNLAAYKRQLKRRAA
jgi:hypothetical protein